MGNTSPRAIEPVTRDAKRGGVSVEHLWIKNLHYTCGWNPRKIYEFRSRHHTPVVYQVQVLPSEESSGRLILSGIEGMAGLVRVLLEWTEYD